MARRKASRRGRQRQQRRREPMLLSKHNYKLILISVVALLVGYLMMAIEQDVDGFLSLYVAPLILFAGYLNIIYALLWRPKEAREADAKLEQPAEAA